MHRPLLILLVLILVAAGGFAFWRVRSSRPASSPATGATSSQQAKSGTPQPNRIRLIATGDTIAHDAINSRAKQADGSYDYLQFMAPIKPFFDKADIRFCNQAVPSGGAAFGISGYPVFNSPLEIVRDMAALGCNVINTGTNHTFDKGQSVINAELNEWDKQPHILAVAGANRSQAEADKIRYFTIKNVKFAFLSYTTYTNSKITTPYAVTFWDENVAKSQTTEARGNADIVLVSMRWGTEYSSGVNGVQQQYAQKLADFGADIVFGHGPHVLEPVQQLKGKNGRQTTVWYSVGNFLNAQLPIESLTSCVVVMDIDPATKTIQPPACMPVYMHYEWTATQKASEDLLSRNNFTITALDQAAGLLKRSQNNTTLEAQTDRIKKLLNTYTPVTMLTSASY